MIVTSPVSTRWMVDSDVPHLIAIERECFRYPMDREDFDVITRSRKGMVWVAEQDAQVVGVMTVETGKNINILSLAVVPTARRRGVASALIGDLKRFAKLRQKMIVMEVPDWSLDVHQFLRSCGFRANRIMDNYFGSNGDAYQFVFRGGKIR